MSLDVRALAAGDAGVPAVRDVDLHVPAGACVLLTGPSGSGKSVLVRALAGAVPVLRGQVRVAGERVDQLQPHERARRGLLLVPSGGAVFPALTTRENLLLGAVRRGQRRTGEDVDVVVETLPQLAPLLDQPAGSLSGGERQMTAVGRALVSDARVLLLDDVTLGLAPAVADQVYAALTALRERGAALVLVDQPSPRALRLADARVVMAGGRVRAVDEPERATCARSPSGASTSASPSPSA